MVNRADPEFVTHEEQEDPKVEVKARQRMNLLGFLRLVIGQVRDSSGRPNNMLALVYAYFIFFCVAVFWVTHPAPVNHKVTLYCENKPARMVKKPEKSKVDPRNVGMGKTGSIVEKASRSLSKVKEALGLKSGRGMVKNVQNATFLCSGSTISATINLPKQTELPASFWWVLLIPFGFLTGVYVSRRPAMRTFLVNLMLAYRGVHPVKDVPVDWKEEIITVIKDQVAGKPDEPLIEPPDPPGE
jgi:hypothetical protein